MQLMEKTFMLFINNQTADFPALLHLFSMGLFLELNFV